MKVFTNLKKREGFTLIELMIVVAIIGILAAIAIPNFLRFQLRSKAGEGKVNLAAIRTAEEGYYAEFNTYVAAAISPRAAAALDDQKATWSDLGGAGASFDTLGWAPEGDVFYAYTVNANSTAGTAPFDRFTAAGASDIDDDATFNVWGYVKPAVGSTGGAANSVAGGAAAPWTTCQAAGAYDVQNAAIGLYLTVSPCAAGHGQSIF
jgi:type IV pilus assembly protein PilA